MRLDKGPFVFLLILVTGIARGQTSAPSAPQVGTSNGSSGVPAERTYAADECDKPPRYIYVRSPDYPDTARKARKQGNVRVGFIVGSNGLTREIRILRSLSPDLDHAAVEAVKKWRFEPAKKNKESVAVHIEAEINFTM